MSPTWLPLWLALVLVGAGLCRACQITIRWEICWSDGVCFTEHADDSAQPSRFNLTHATDVAVYGNGSLVLWFQTLPRFPDITPNASNHATVTRLDLHVGISGCASTLDDDGIPQTSSSSLSLFECNRSSCSSCCNGGLIIVLDASFVSTFTASTSSSGEARTFFFTVSDARRPIQGLFVTVSSESIDQPLLLENSVINISNTNVILPFAASSGGGQLLRVMGSETVVRQVLYSQGTDSWAAAVSSSSFMGSVGLRASAVVFSNCTLRLTNAPLLTTSSTPIGPASSVFAFQWLLPVSQGSSVSWTTCRIFVTVLPSTSTSSSLSARSHNVFQGIHERLSPLLVASTAGVGVGAIGGLVYFGQGVSNQSRVELDATSVDINWEGVPNDSDADVYWYGSQTAIGQGTGAAVVVSVGAPFDNNSFVVLTSAQFRINVSTAASIVLLDSSSGSDSRPLASLVFGSQLIAENVSATVILSGPHPLASSSGGIPIGGGGGGSSSSSLSASGTSRVVALFAVSGVSQNASDDGASILISASSFDLVTIQDPPPGAATNTIGASVLVHALVLCYGPVIGANPFRRTPEEGMDAIVIEYSHTRMSLQSDPRYRFTSAPRGILSVNLFASMMLLPGSVLSVGSSSSSSSSSSTIDYKLQWSAFRMQNTSSLIAVGGDDGHDNPLCPKITTTLELSKGASLSTTSVGQVLSASMFLVAGTPLRDVTLVAEACSHVVRFNGGSLADISSCPAAATAASGTATVRYQLFPIPIAFPSVNVTMTSVVQVGGVEEALLDVLRGMLSDPLIQLVAPFSIPSAALFVVDMRATVRSTTMSVWNVSTEPIPNRLWRRDAIISLNCAHFHASESHLGVPIPFLVEDCVLPMSGIAVLLRNSAVGGRSSISIAVRRPQLLNSASALANRNGVIAIRDVVQALNDPTIPPLPGIYSVLSVEQAVVLFPRDGYLIAFRNATFLGPLSSAVLINVSLLSSAVEDGIEISDDFFGPSKLLASSNDSPEAEVYFLPKWFGLEAPRRGPPSLAAWPSNFSSVKTSCAAVEGRILSSVGPTLLATRVATSTGTPLPIPNTTIPLTTVPTLYVLMPCAVAPAQPPLPPLPFTVPPMPTTSAPTVSPAPAAAAAVALGSGTPYGPPLHHAIFIWIAITVASMASPRGLVSTLPAQRCALVARLAHLHGYYRQRANLNGLNATALDISTAFASAYLDNPLRVLPVSKESLRLDVATGVGAAIGLMIVFALSSTCYAMVNAVALRPHSMSRLQYVTTWVSTATAMLSQKHSSSPSSSSWSYGLWWYPLLTLQLPVAYVSVGLMVLSRDGTSHMSTSASAAAGGIMGAAMFLCFCAGPAIWLAIHFMIAPAAAIEWQVVPRNSVGSKWRRFVIEPLYDLMPRDASDSSRSRNRSGSSETELVVRATRPYKQLFLTYDVHRLWFVLVDFLVSFVFGAAAGASWWSYGTASWSILLTVSIVMLLVKMLTRPWTMLCDSVISILSEILVLAALSNAIHHVDHAETLLSTSVEVPAVIAAVLCLLSSLLSVARGLLGSDEAASRSTVTYEAYGVPASTELCETLLCTNDERQRQEALQEQEMATTTTSSILRGGDEEDHDTNRGTVMEANLYAPPTPVISVERGKQHRTSSSHLPSSPAAPAAMRPKARRISPSVALAQLLQMICVARAAAATFSVPTSSVDVDADDFADFVDIELSSSDVTIEDGEASVNSDVLVTEAPVAPNVDLR